MKIRLNPFLLKHTTMFLSPDEGGGSGGGGNPASSGDGGEGGGGGGGNVQDDPIANFTAPSVDDVLDSIKGNEPPADPANPNPAPKKPDPVNPPPKEGNGKAGEPPAKQLRQELENAKQELANLKATLEKGDPRLTEAQNAVKAKQEELENHKKELEAIRRQLGENDPAIRKPLTDLEDAYNRQSATFFNRVPELDHNRFNQLLTEYSNLPFGKPEYRDAYREFEKKVNETLGGSEDQEHRRLGQVVNFIEETNDFVRKRHELVEDIRKNVFNRQHEVRMTEYTKKKTQVGELVEKAWGLPEGLKETDPLHPRVAIHTFYEAIGEERSKEFDKGIRDFVQLALAGTAPRSDSDYAGMTPEQIRDSQANEQAVIERTQAHLPDVLINGLRAMRILPALIKDWKRQAEQIEKMNGGHPPDPTREGDGGGGGGGNTGDEIADYQPPSLDDLRL